MLLVRAVFLPLAQVVPVDRMKWSLVNVFDAIHTDILHKQSDVTDCISPGVITVVHEFLHEKPKAAICEAVVDSDLLFQLANSGFHFIG